MLDPGDGALRPQLSLRVTHLGSQSPVWRAYGVACLWPPHLIREAHLPSDSSTGGRPRNCRYALRVCKRGGQRHAAPYAALSFRTFTRTALPPIRVIRGSSYSSATAVKGTVTRDGNLGPAEAADHIPPIRVIRGSGRAKGSAALAGDSVIGTDLPTRSQRECR